MFIIKANGILTPETSYLGQLQARDDPICSHKKYNCCLWAADAYQGKD